jgi:hypothetical protein
MSIPELSAVDNLESEFTFQLDSEPWQQREPIRWLNHWYLYDGSKWLSFARLESGYLLRFPAFADFTVSVDGHEICCYPRVQCPVETIRHLLLNQVIPIVLSQLGKLVLHAAACGTPQGVMAFMGTTGMGKSTLAASLGLQGFQILTDDCLLIEKHEEETICVPSYAGIRLWPESVTALFENEPEQQSLAHYTDKKRVFVNQPSFSGSNVLKSVYVLAQSNSEREISGVTILPLTASEALFEIIKHTFQLDVTDQQRLGQAFKRYEWLARSAPFFKLTYPRDHTYLPAVNKAVLEHLEMLQDRQLAAS